MILKDCTKIHRETKIKISENNSNIYINNANSEEFSVIKYDGCCVKNELAADYIVQGPCKNMLLVELKGSDIKHGIKQIDATSKKMFYNGYKKPFHGIIIFNSFPKVNTIIQRAKTQFKKSYSGNLHFCKSGTEKKFGELVK